MRARPRLGMTSSTPQPVTRPDRIIAAAVALLALVSRLAFLLGAPDRAWPHSILYEGDAPVWIEWARALRAGVPFQFDLPLRPPGIAYLLHWLDPHAIQAPFLGAKIAWCVLSAATCGLAYLVFRRGFARGVALIAAALLVFAYGSAVTAVSLNNETPYTFLLVLIVGGTLALNARPRMLLAVGLGVAHGLATLLRAEHTLLLVLLLLFSGWSLSRRPADEPSGASARPRRPAAVLLVVLLASVVVCLPWSLQGSAAARAFNAMSPELPPREAVQPPWTADARETLEALPGFAREGNFRFITVLAREAGRAEVTQADVLAFFHDRFGYVPEPVTTWVFVSMKGPLDFALANHPRADGGFSKAALDDGLSPDPPLSFGRPSHLRLINRGYSVGLGWIADDPVGWLRLVGRKLARFGDGATLGLTSLNLPYGRTGIRRPVDLATPNPGARPWWRVLVLGLLVAGLVMAARRRRGGAWMLVIAYKLVVTVLFYGYARQAVSIQPALAIFVAVPIGALADAGARRLLDGRRRWGAVAGLILVLVLFAADLAGSFGPRDVDVRPLTPRGGLVVDETLAPGAVRCDDLLELKPATGPLPAP